MNNTQTPSSSISALAAFSAHLPRHAKVLDAGCGSGDDLVWLRDHGFQGEGFDLSSEQVALAQARQLQVWQKDFRFISLKHEEYDGIWCHRAISHLRIEETQRVMASFFQALKPKTGLLFVTFLTQPTPGLFHYPENSFLSLLRQSGFQPLFRGEWRDDQNSQNNWMALLLKRV